jgi:hypothetical protein
MGADFLLAFVPYCKITPEREQILRGILNNLAIGDLSDALEWKGSFAYDFDNEEEELKSARETAIQAFEEYIDGENSRDVTWLIIGGVKYLFSGGMSYGDSPTTAFDYIMFLSQVEPVWEKLEDWSREDVKALRAKKVG